jgi:glutamate-1-semialdehyde 2,1-aminomutase
VTPIEAAFRERTRRSSVDAKRAAQVMPGGDTRAAEHHPPYQLTMTSAEGAYLTDLHGNRYIDLIGNFTSLVHGNAYPPAVEAAARAAANGSNAVARAAELVARVPSVSHLGG